MAIELTKQQKDRAIRELYDRLLNAIEETPRGIDDYDIKQVIERVCQDCDIQQGNKKIGEIK